jgi:hypothetical protein
MNLGVGLFKKEIHETFSIYAPSCISGRSDRSQDKCLSSSNIDGTALLISEGRIRLFASLSEMRFHKVDNLQENF